MCTIVRINTQGSMDYDYKEFILRYLDPFAEIAIENEFVIRGNKNYNSLEEAEWYENASNLINDIYQNTDCNNNLSDEDKKVLAEKYKISEDVFEKINFLYARCISTNSITASVVNLLYPERKFVRSTLKGSVQSEWQEVICEEKYLEILPKLSDAYFGYMAEILVEMYDGIVCSDIITLSEFWELERKGELNSYIKDTFDLDDEIIIYKSEGYVTTTRWVQIS